MGLKTVCIVALLLGADLAQADLGPGGPAPMTALSQEADLIIVATLQSVVASPAEGDVVQLAVRGVLRGSAGSLEVTAVFSQPDYDLGLVGPRTPGPKSGLLPGSWVGRTGVWFLQSGSPYYQVIPTSYGSHNAIDAFLPVANPDVPGPPPGTVVQEVLWYLMQWYLSLPNPNNGDDQRIFMSLGLAAPADSLAADSLLINSGLADQTAVWIEMLLRLNSDSAVSALVSNIGVIQASSKFTRVLSDFGLFYHPKGEGALPALQNLLSQHLAIPGMDLALGTALARIGTKNVLPSMAEMLDSQDPQAQLRAASFFANFAMFADANGNIPGTQVSGPFDSVAGRANTPKRGSAETPAEYAQFWKAWWSTNRAALGFPTP